VFEEIRDQLSGVARLSPQDLTQMINSDQVVVLDIRDKTAFDQGHILNAINIPSAELMANLNKLEKYKNKSIVIIDGGGQGLKIATNLRKQGFKLYSLAGGLNGWKAQGLPLTKK
jgi:rhodanese-related sulfurtransferase